MSKLDANIRTLVTFYFYINYYSFLVASLSLLDSQSGPLEFLITFCFDEPINDQFSR